MSKIPEKNWKQKAVYKARGLAEIFHKHSPIEKEVIKGRGQRGREFLGDMRSIGALRSQVAEKMKHESQIKASKKKFGWKGNRLPDELIQHR